MAKALSIRQPWAWLIVNGHKPVENRTWEIFYRGSLLIHAGQTMTRGDYDACMTFLLGNEQLRPIAALLPVRGELELGGIVGRAELVSCTRLHESPFFVGPFGFGLVDARPLPFQPLKGALGLFSVPGVVA